jgi:hypothetical protein
MPFKMRRTHLFILAFLLHTPAYAQISDVNSSAASVPETSLFHTSGFHFFAAQCKVEANEAEEIETTPQSPPLTVDDPGTPGCNRWEINFVVDGDITRDARSWDLPLLDINYGVGDNLQLKYEVPNVNSQSGDTQVAAVGDSKAGLKYQFYGDEESRTQIAFYPQVQFRTPGPRDTPVSPEDQGTVTTLPFLLARTIGRNSRGDINVSANLGYNISSRASRANFASAALGIGMPLIRRIAFLAEVTTEQAVDVNLDGLREQLVKIDVGVVGPISKHFLGFGSIGRSLVSSDRQDHTYVLAGLRLLTEGF